MNNILVTGGTGLLGKSLSNERSKWKFISTSDVDLIDPNSTRNYFDTLRPSKVVHAAAKVGGIRENSVKPYDFIKLNNLINSNVISWCVDTNTPIIFISSTCVYPKTPHCYPMTEDMVFSGEPEETNDGYAYAKRFATSMLRAAQKQKDLKYTVLYLCNLYGEYDHFVNDSKSHLVTALIKKFHEAKMNNSDSVELLGTGKPLRQFMYAKDAAKIIANLVENDVYGEYNLSIDKNLSVMEIAEIIRKVVGYNGNVRYNGSLDGVFRKDVSSEKLKNTAEIGSFTSLQEGVTITYEKYLESLICGN